MEPINQRPTLEALPQEVLETIVEFCGDVATISPSEQTDTFTEDIVKPYLDSAASNEWQPAYKDLQLLSLVSRTFTNAAQRALFKVAVVEQTDTFLHDVIHPYLDSAASNTWQPAYRDLQALALTSKTFTNPAQRALKLRELRLVDDFDKMIRYPDNRESNHATGNSEQVRILNWNDIILEYKDTLEVLVMGWHRPIAMRLKPRFGASGMLSCLPEMGKLRYLKAPLITLGGGDFIVPLGDDGKLIELVRTELPASLRKIDLMVVNPPTTRAEGMTLKWRVVECRL